MEPRPRGSYRSRLVWEEIRVPYFMNKPTTGMAKYLRLRLGRGREAGKCLFSHGLGGQGVEQEWGRTQGDKEAGKDKEAGGEWEK